MLLLPRLTPCTPQVRGGTRELLEKASVYEADVAFDERVRSAAPLFRQLAADTTLLTMLSVLLPGLGAPLTSQAIKLQYNSGGGGCFPMHFDTAQELRDGRRVTAIFYLNPGWQPGDGGHLRLFPVPRRPVDIAPRHNRLVLFSSASMLHRVLPSAAPRYCFTAWMASPTTYRRRGEVVAAAGSGGGGQLWAAGTKQEAAGASVAGTQDGEAAASTSAAADALAHLMQPAIRPHVCKYVYADEWAKSLAESHPPGPALESAVARHVEEVGTIRTALAAYLSHLDALKRHLEAAPHISALDTVAAAAAAAGHASAGGAARAGNLHGSAMAPASGAGGRQPDDGSSIYSRCTVKWF